MKDRALKYGEKTVLVSGFRCPESKKEEFRAKCYAILDAWLVDGIEVNDPEILTNSIPLINKEKNDTTKEESEILEIKNIEKEEITEINILGREVSSLPKERKMVIEENLKGLYTANQKWYTNKIVDNKLTILEWDTPEDAKYYLKSLNK